MKKILENPIMINIELNLLEDIIKIIGSAIHSKFCHDDIEEVKKVLISKGQKSVQDYQKNQSQTEIEKKE
jgi:hypothetical protein